MKRWKRLIERFGASRFGAADWMIVGLGNPGSSYQDTRHNLGYRAVTRLAERHGLEWEPGRGHSLLAPGRIAGDRVVLVQPLTYVNESGRAVAPLSRRLRLDPSRVLVAYDDLDLAPGQIRLRPRGGPGGHRGMESILASLGTEEVPRVRIGIGRPPVGLDAVAFVLAEMSPPELQATRPAVERAADALEAVVAVGLEAAMTEFNRALSGNMDDAA